MILNDKQIKELVEKEEMIKPFVDKSIAQGISHGLNSFGFDVFDQYENGLASRVVFSINM